MLLDLLVRSWKVRPYARVLVVVFCSVYLVVTVRPMPNSTPIFALVAVIIAVTS
jgi:hypothetical protein